MDFAIRHLPDLAALGVMVCAQIGLARRFRGFRAPAAIGTAWILFGFLFGIPDLNRILPPDEWIEWVRSAGVMWGLAGTVLWVSAVASGGLRARAEFDPGRRRLLGWMRAAATLAPAAVAGYGIFLERHNLRLVEVKAPVPGLPKDLEGLRLAQITDIHYGAYLGKRELQRAVAMANETKPHVTLVTGDLITVRRDSLEDCLSILRELRAEAGLYGCHGNHEISADCEEEATRLAARFGLRFLRGEKAMLRFGQGALNLAGVDYQSIRKPYLRGAEDLVDGGAVNVLLSHNPDVFPTAAEKGFDLTVAGHTHGGQVTVEYLHQYLNVVRFYTRYVYGLYEEKGRLAWVGRGLGTVGIPARVGAPPEVALIRLCAT